MTCRSVDAGAVPPLVALYQPKMFWNSAVPRDWTVKVCPHVGWKVSGRICAAVAGFNPDWFDGMHELSFGECQRVVSHVPFCPFAQLVEPPGHGAPMLQTPATVHAHAMTGRSPVGAPPLHPMGDGICAPFGCVRAQPLVERATQARETERTTPSRMFVTPCRVTKKLLRAPTPVHPRGRTNRRLRPAKRGERNRPSGAGSLSVSGAGPGGDRRARCTLVVSLLSSRSRRSPSAPPSLRDAGHRMQGPPKRPPRRRRAEERMPPSRRRPPRCRR